jgi:hypothetical protein
MHDFEAMLEILFAFEFYFWNIEAPLALKQLLNHVDVNVVYEYYEFVWILYCHS